MDRTCLYLLTLVKVWSQKALSKHVLSEWIYKINAKNSSSMYDSLSFTEFMLADSSMCCEKPTLLLIFLFSVVLILNTFLRGKM